MGFVVYILISLITHLAELGLNCFLAYSLWLDGESRVWFSLIAGLLIIPLVTVQLVSAILLLQRQNENLASWRLILMAFTHVMLLGFHWRHLSFLLEKDVNKKKKDLTELCLLRFIYTFTSSLPLLLIISFLLLGDFTSSLLLILLIYAAIGTTLISSSWAIASYRKLKQPSEQVEDIVPTCCGTFFRFLWRMGEIMARILSLVLFATLYHHWIYLVLTLHWITMCLCVFTSVLAGISGTGCYRVVKGMITAYVYIFCFININKNNSAFRYSFFYIIMVLENATLCVVWMVMDDYPGYYLVYITVGASLVCIASMCIYFKFFHRRTHHSDEDQKDDMCRNKDCINCKLNLCAKHNKEQQRTFHPGWLSQYQSGLTEEQFYKYLLQESFVESSVPGDRNSTISTALSNPNMDFKNLETMSDEERRSVISFLTSRNYVHRQYMEQLDHLPGDDWSDYTTDTPSISNERFSCSSCDTDSSPYGSWPEQDNYVPKLSVLLTEDCDAIQETKHGQIYLKRLDSFHSLLRRDAHNMQVLNAGSDRNLQWSQLPVTMLDRQKYTVPSENETDSCSSDPTARDVSVRTNARKANKRNKKRVEGRSETRGDNSSKKSKNRKYKLNRNVGYVNEDHNVYMEMRVPVKKLPAVYENVAYMDEILTEPSKVFKVVQTSENSKAPWYTCSESGDSALPTETFSSTSNCGLTDVDNDSHSSQEFMI
ncbi:hypothetical protein SNE40_012077 [Patella caerulea]|uniref:XK-related protein n=1 Tax=Patella caerulea TaxID=87958 RepID=A0AAN8PVA0_PATCE